MTNWPTPRVVQIKKVFSFRHPDQELCLWTLLRVLPHPDACSARHVAPNFVPGSANVYNSLSASQNCSCNPQ